MKISVEPFGTLPDGTQVLSYMMENNNGMRVQILNYGGIIHSLEVPDRDGNVADVVLGHATLEDYITNIGTLNAIVGRNANRLENAKVSIFENTYDLEANRGPHNLHSGSHGLTRRVLTSEVHSYNNLPVVLLSHKIEDMSDGFPGNLTVNIIYALTDDNALMIDYRAVCDKDTIINMTNHAYFNLAGHDSGPVYGHMLQMNSRFYTPSTNEGIPTGEILQVQGTPFDFTTAKPVGQDIGSSYPQVQQFDGYDHNFVLDGSDYRKVATVTEPTSGRKMEVFTDLPGIQFYTGNGLDPARVHKNGVHYVKHQGLCLETQTFPNGANIPWFPSPIFAAGEEYVSTTTYQFSAE